MRLKAWIISAALAAACGAALAQDAAPASPGLTFWRLRTEGVAAANAGDLAGADAKFDAADAAVPNHPGLTLLRARLEAAGGRLPAAVALMDRYARFGFVVDTAADETLQRIAAADGFAPVRQRLEANARPTGGLETVGRIEGPFLAEAVAYDAARDRYLVSGIHGRTIVALKPGGAPAPYLAADPDIDSVQALAVDRPRGVLWASTSARPQAKDMPADHKGRAGLLKIDLASGRVLARYDAPRAEDRALGDMTVAADGTVYAADSITGEIWRLKPGAAALDRVLAGGVLLSPQSMVATPDGRRLIVADYVSGLNVLDLATGRVTRLPVPDDLSLSGTDGLVRDGDSLIAFQNGTRPQRLVRVVMDRGLTRATGWSVLAANLPDLAEPTTGAVVGDDLVFVARSQWTDFKDDGSLRASPPGPAVIARLKLR